VIHLLCQCFCVSTRLWSLLYTELAHARMKAGINATRSRFQLKGPMPYRRATNRVAAAGRSHEHEECSTQHRLLDPAAARGEGIEGKEATIPAWVTLAVVRSMAITA
jgi:hypothetical protein